VPLILSFLQVCVVALRPTGAAVAACEELRISVAFVIVDMVEMEQKVERLEALLGEFIVATKTAITRLERAVERFEEAGARDRAESAKFRAEMNKRWGDLANKMGTLVEDIVAPNVPRTAREHFGAAELELFAVRGKRRKAGDPCQRRDFDVVAVGDEVVVWTDVKSNPRPEYVQQFVEALPAFFDFFPEYQGRRLVPVFASLYLPPEIVTYLTRSRAYGLAMGDEVMELVNGRELQQSR